MDILALAFLLNVQAQPMPLCAPWDVMVTILTEERAQRRRSTSLDQENLLIEFWASDENGSWTVILTQPSGMSCEVFTGQAFEWVDEPLKRKPNS